MPGMTAGHAVVEVLAKDGVEYVFGVVGSTFLEILDGLHGREDIRFIGVRHEQSAAFMADGYARASGNPGVCMATSGPGATNLVTGISASYMAHSPVLAIIGSPPTGSVHRDSFQEIDHVSLFRPITKASLNIPAAKRVPELLRHALRVATSGKMGPVFVEVPRDVLGEDAGEVELLSPEAYRPEQRLEGALPLVEEAARLLKEARAPRIIAGGGVNWSQAGQEVVRLAELLSIPMVTAYARNDAVPNDHPLYIGPLGRAGSPEAAEAIRSADVILAVGTRLSEFTTFYDHRYIPEEARIIQIEIDPKEIGRNYPVAVGILGDAEAVVARLLRVLEGAVKEGPNEERLGYARDLREKRRQRWQGEAQSPSTPIKAYQVYHEMRKVLPEGVAILVDAGAACARAYDRVVMNRPRSFFSPLDLGCLGFSFPTALGVKMADPGRTVVSVNGDGGFLFNAQELETAVRCQIPVVAIVMNNNSWGSEKAYQKEYYQGRFVGADITNPRFDQLARLFGAQGFYAQHLDQVGDVLQAAIGSGQPAVVEIPVDPEDLPPPLGIPGR